MVEVESYHHAQRLKESLHSVMQVQAGDVDLLKESRLSQASPLRHSGGGSKYSREVRVTLWIDAWKKGE